MKIDFKEIALRSLDSAKQLLQEWFPLGKISGDEFTIGNLSGDAGSSLSINMHTGIWKDFATGEGGADLISLYAAVNQLSQLDACRVLATKFGYQHVDNYQYTVPQSVASTPRAKNKSPWQPVLPVPADALPVPVAHPVRGRYVASWAYHDKAGQLLGYVCRFVKSDGSKEILPLIYAQDTSRTAPTFAWRWNQFPEPRPLYGLQRLKDNGPVLIVEGEKCTDAGHQLLASHGFSVLSWSGGANAVKKADWSVLKGREVTLWPDSDSQLNTKTGNYLNKTAQPGHVAMQSVAKILSELGCKITVLDLPAPGTQPDGWDIADMIDEGADANQVLAYLRDNSQPFDIERSVPHVNSFQRLKDIPFSTPLLTNPNTGAVKDCQQNITLLLEELPELQGQIKLNELSGRVEAMGNLPWDKSAKVRDWRDGDDLELMDYLFRQYRCSFNSTQHVLNGVALAAARNTYHPLADWLRSLRWDGIDRLTNWLHAYLGAEDNDYIRLVGPMWLRQAVNRALHAGVKADYVLILEGRQGLRKSTALRVLGGDWFSDVPLNLDSQKEAAMSIEGVWIHEVAELDAFNRSESTAIKAFFTRPVDRFRAPFGRRYEDQSRHTVFAGTTNSEEYLKDNTGNRRFWPVRCSAIDIEGLTKDRTQLFAQAFAELQAGKRTYPIYEEEQEIIKPVQQLREISDAWEVKIADYLTDPRHRNIKRLTMVEVMEDVLGLDISRVTSTRQQETKVGAILRKLGWSKKRESKAVNGYRGYYYERMEGEP